MPSVALAVGLVTLVAVGLASGLLASRVGPWSRADEPFTQVEHWIAEHTPADALIAAPPNRSTFRLTTRRSVVVSFKAAPFNDSAMQEWYTRLLDLASRATSTRARGLAFGEHLDDAYAANETDDWARLAQNYGITHVVRNRAGGTAPAGRPVFESGSWVVYEIAPSTLGGEGDDTSLRLAP